VIALLAAAALAAVPQSGPTAQQMGRASVYAGMCSTLGWVSSQEQVVAQAQAYLDSHPEQTDAEVQVLMNEGIEQARTEIDGMLAAYRASHDGNAMKATLRRECDGIVRDLPAFLSRSAETDTQFEARMAEVLGGN